MINQIYLSAKYSNNTRTITHTFILNILSGKESNFNKYSHGKIDVLKQTYDLNSIMHYGNYFFSKNGQPTIKGIGPNKNVNLGQRAGPTQTDIFEVNALYDCSGMNTINMKN